MRVVVVGAGLAGLTATQHLHAAGVDVELVEAGDRPGGRARTVRAGFAEGQLVESGAEWVDTIHTRMLTLLDRYGLTLQGEGQEWTTIRRWLFREGQLLGPADLHRIEPALEGQLERFERIVEEATTGIVDGARPQDHPQASVLDSVSLADVAHEAELGAIARLFHRRDSQGEFAEEPHGVSLLFLAQGRAVARDASAGRAVRAHRVSEGLDSLVSAMASDVESRLSLGETLLIVRQHDDHVEVITSRRQLVAHHVVLACSLRALRSVRFEPDLPAPLHRAVRELGYGTVTKTAVQFPHRTWPTGYATTAGRAQRVYEPTADQLGRGGVLMSYCGGDGGRELARLDESARLDLVAEELQGMYGILEAPTSGFSRAWSNEPRYGGSYACYGPGQVTAFWEALRRPHGRIWLAGEHTATFCGYLEGAVESGETVSAGILGAG